MPHPYFTGTATPRILAHRGLVTPEQAAQGIAENTQSAVRSAIDAGADYVESDCHLTRDGVVVLFHDDNLSRVTGDRRAVAEVSLEQMRSLMAGRGGLLTLEEMLEQFPTTRFNIDAKSDAVAVPAARIIGRHSERVLLTSFSDKRRERALAAAVEVSGGTRPATSAGQWLLVRLLIAVQLRAQNSILKLLRDVDALQIPETYRGVRVLSARLIEAVHTADREVHVWTVNDPVRMKELVAMGVDGIITDRADLAIAALR